MNEPSQPNETGAPCPVPLPEDESDLGHELPRNMTASGLIGAVGTGIIISGLLLTAAKPRVTMGATASSKLKWEQRAADIEAAVAKPASDEE